MSHVTLDPVTDANEQAFRSLYNLYLHDLAAYQPAAVDETGSYDAGVVDNLLDHTDKGANLFLIRSDGQLSGLMVHSGPPLVEPGCDFHLYELFVLNHLKGRGVAGDAVRALLAAYPGRYGLGVLKTNTRARAFWERFLGGHGTNVTQTDQHEAQVAYTFDLAASAPQGDADA